MRFAAAAFAHAMAMAMAKAAEMVAQKDLAGVVKDGHKSQHQRQLEMSFEKVGDGTCLNNNNLQPTWQLGEGTTQEACSSSCSIQATTIHSSKCLLGFQFDSSVCRCLYDVSGTCETSTTSIVSASSVQPQWQCYKRVEESSAAPGLSLADYEGTSVVGEVQGEQSSCTAEASAGTDKITCNFEWRDADGAVKTSVSGAKLYSDIIAGTCDDAIIEGGGAFKTTVANSNESTNGATSATLTGTVTAGEKTGTVIKTYCARADLKDDTEGVSVLAAMTQVVVTYIYDQTGTFSVDNIATSPFNAEMATAEDTRGANLNAFLSNDEGVELTETSSYEVGTVLNIGIQSGDTDVKIDITSLEIKKTADTSYDPAITPIDANGPNFVTTKTCGDAGGNLCVVGTLLVPRIYDENSSGSIVVTGTAALTYVTGRRLHSKDTRALQADAEEAFELEVELKGQDGLPQIATAENSGSFVGASSAAFAAIAAGYAIIA